MNARGSRNNRNSKSSVKQAKKSVFLPPLPRLGPKVKKCVFLPPLPLLGSKGTKRKAQEQKQKQPLRSSPKAKLASSQRLPLPQRKSKPKLKPSKKRGVFLPPPPKLIRPASKKLASNVFLAKPPLLTTKEKNQDVSTTRTKTPIPKASHPIANPQMGNNNATVTGKPIKQIHLQPVEVAACPVPTSTGDRVIPMRPINSRERHHRGSDRRHEDRDSRNYRNDTDRVAHHKDINYRRAENDRRDGSYREAGNSRSYTRDRRISKRSVKDRDSRRDNIDSRDSREERSRGYSDRDRRHSETDKRHHKNAEARSGGKPASIVKRRDEICKFFRTGHCRRGDNCTFSHDLKSEACLYFRAGNCTLGSACKYSHDPAVVQAAIKAEEDEKLAIIRAAEKEAEKLAAKTPALPPALQAQIDASKELFVTTASSSSGGLETRGYVPTSISDYDIDDQPVVTEKEEDVESVLITPGGHSASSSLLPTPGSMSRTSTYVSPFSRVNSSPLAPPVIPQVVKKVEKIVVEVTPEKKSSWELLKAAQ